MTSDQLNVLVNGIASVTLFEMMVSVGLGASAVDIVGVGRRWRLVARAALASYVLVPAVAAGLLIAFQAHPFVAVGFLVAAVCPGAPYGPPFTGLAKGNVPMSVGLMVLLAGSSAFMAPLLLQSVTPIVFDFLPPLPDDAPALQIDGGKIVKTLLVAQFVPLCLGLAIRQWGGEWAGRLQKPAKLLSVLLNLATLSLILATQAHMLLGIPLRGYLGMSLLVAASVAIGWLLAGSADRPAMVMATSVRNVGVSLVIVTAAFPGTRAVAAATAFAVFQTIIVAIVAVVWGRLRAKAA